MAPSSKPTFIVVPGASQSPAHYGYFQHLLLSQGYPVVSALLPSVGSNAPITAEDDAEYIRSRLLLPVLDGEKHNVIMISGSYSGIPASAAARGLGKADRAAEGKSTSVLGQIFFAAILARGGDGKDMIATLGGQFPPHIEVDERENLLKCENPKPAMYQDVSPVLADAVAASSMNQGMTSFTSPCPPASWDAEAFKGRCAYVRTLYDQAIPLQIQNMMLQATGQEWITRDVESGHSPQLVAPEQSSNITIELAKMFETM